jgi:DNA-binding transcriptional MocR family regulator
MLPSSIDDPYFYLYYGTAPRTPSYFSLEKDVLPETGRVLRFDSFSKILSAGLRLGFASGPETILGAIERYVSGLVFTSLHAGLATCAATKAYMPNIDIDGYRSWRCLPLF